MVLQFILKKDFLTYVFNWLYFTYCLSLFSSIDHLLHLCAWFLSLFHLTVMRFSWSTHLLMFLPLETLMSIIRTGLPILVELINLVNSARFFTNDLTFLLRSQTVILIVLLFWIYFFLLTLVFVLQWLFLHWEILIMLLSQFPVSIDFPSNSQWSLWSFERCSMGGYL